MSGKATYLVWQTGTKLTPLERGILAKFAAWWNPADPENSIYPSQEYLAWLFTTAETTVRRALRKLESIGYITSVRVGKGANNRYTLDLDAIEADERPEWISKSDRSKAAVKNGGSGRSRAADNGGPIEDETIETKPETEDSFALKVVDASELSEKQLRAALRAVYIQVHGVAATKGEAKLHNAHITELREAQVTAAEYPRLCQAFVSMKDCQPAPYSVAKKVGELRNYLLRGPMQAPNPEELAEKREWERLQSEYETQQEALP